jgi:iron complex outermembrane receptor protein
MKIFRSMLIGTAVAVAIFGQRAFAADQQVPSSDTVKTSDTNQNLEEVVVTGIAYSLKESLATKRASTNQVEVVTAEDVGKLPDKNVADVLQRVPGINTQSAASGEGGFDENNRVALRGTSASLTQTTVNGHAVATGDWFLLDQFQTVGRSVSYDLLPSEMVARTVVYKTQSADMIEGGVAGSVDLQTPKPLDFKQTFTAAATAGGVYSDLPSKTEPQANAMFNWQNGQMGLMAMGFFEKRDSRRDGQEVLGYAPVPAATAAAWQAANPSLPNAAGAQYPTLLGQALFTQTRKREGGAADFEVKPTDNLTLDVNGFYSHLDADNTNRNFLMFGSHFIAPNYVPTSLSVGNGTLLGGTWPTIPGQPVADGNSKTGIPYNTAVYDQILRPGAASETYYVDFDGTLVASDTVTLDGQVGYTHGVGDTPQQPAVESQGGNGVTYALHGLSNPASINYTGLNVSSPAGFFTDYAFGDIAKSIDQEVYGQLNALFKVDSGIFQSVKVGARFSAHNRTEEFPEDQGCPVECGANGLSPAFSGATYPGNYDQNLGGGGYPTNIFEYTTGQIEGFDSTALSHGPSRYYWQGAFQVRERDTALYAMANIGGDHWSGNFGLRLVNTQELDGVNVAGGAHPITTSLFGPFTPTEVDNRYVNVLPSANLKFDLSPSLVLRASAAETMARPDYSALGGAVSLTDLNTTGNGGNPNLRPIRSSNYDAALEWYYAPQALLEVGLFYMDLASYVDFGNTQGVYFDQLLGKPETYTISSPFNTSAEVKGAEVAWTQPLGLGFGGQGNVTWSDGETADGSDMVGNSKITYNLGGYYEAHGFSAHVDYTYRSHYLVGLDRSSLENEDSIGNLGAALNYSITKNFALSFNALNLNNAEIKYYAANTSQPRAFYSNGRQYYFEVRFKL